MTLEKFFIRVMNRLGLLSRINLELRSNGVIIPLIRGMGSAHFFEMESWMLEILRKLIPVYCSGDRAFVDVGVNVGQTLLKAKLIDKHVAYIGFEPNPSCLHFLYELVKRNNLRPVTIYPFALGDKTGVVDLALYSDQGTDTMASIVSDFRPNSVSKIKVPLLAGEKFAEWTDSHIGILKIDVEGAELDVLRGMRKIIEKDRPLIICEILPSYSGTNKIRLERQIEIIEFLRSIDYRILLISGDGSTHEKDTIAADITLDETNYIFYPGEIHTTLIAQLNIA